MRDLPINTPDSFGNAVHHESHDDVLEFADSMTVMYASNEAPEPDPQRSRPSVKRLMQGDGVNVIAFNFLPNQNLPDHKAAHPITVQCVEGELEFTCGEETITLVPGTIIHLPAYVPHRVDCPDNEDSNKGPNTLVLMMHTGEQHSGNHQLS